VNETPSYLPAIHLFQAFTSLLAETLLLQSISGGLVFEILRAGRCYYPAVCDYAGEAPDLWGDYSPKGI